MLRRIVVIGAAVSAVAAAGVVTAQFANADAAPSSSSSCSAYEVVAVRRTDDKVVNGEPVTFVPHIRAIQAKVQGVTVYNVPYPAVFDFGASMEKGRTLLKQRLADIATRCPDQKLILMGYSQGAIVVGDVLTEGVKAKIAAVILFGDGRFNGKASFNAGNYRSDRNSIIARPLPALAPYANRVQDYCNADDPACQWGAWGMGHTNYQKYAPAVGTFVAKVA